MLAVEMTEQEVNKLATDTLAEMSEAPPKQPMPEEDTRESSLAWQPRGSWLWAGRNPAELGSDTDGRLILSLSVQTNRPPDLNELSKTSNDANDKARSEALSRLQAMPEWTSYLEANAEHFSIQNRLDALEKEGRDLEAERLRCAGKPKGQGKRLAEIQQRQSEIGKEKHEVGLELQAIRPILADARRQAEAHAGTLALEAVKGIREEQQQALDDALADFYRRHSTELTAIAERLTAKSRQRHDAWVASLKSFVLSRMETANPLPEPSM